MWPFTKPQLSTDVLFDIHTYNRYGKETMKPDRFIETLTRKQIRMLNTFASDAHRSDRLEEEVEKEMHREYSDAIKEIRREDVNRKLCGEFDEVDHIGTAADYANYLNNNRDKAVLSKEEEERLMNMLSRLGRNGEKCAGSDSSK